MIELDSKSKGDGTIGPQQGITDRFLQMSAQRKPSPFLEASKTFFPTNLANRLN